MSETRRPLGWKGTVLVGFGVLGVASMSAATPFAVRARRAEAEKQARTENLLRRRHSMLKAFGCFLGNPPRADGGPLDPTGMNAYWAWYKSLLSSVPDADLDGWGAPIRYRCPGPLHDGGWDLWSCGPDGVDQLGAGDDVGIGADKAVAGSRGHMKFQQTMLHICDCWSDLHQKSQARGAVPRAMGSPEDPTGQRACTLRRYHGPGTPDGVSWFYVDAWGNRLQYRAPGVLHTNGWDLWSFGPNGVDEHGDGDDILVGVDVACVAS